MRDASSQLSRVSMKASRHFEKAVCGKVSFSELPACFSHERSKFRDLIFSRSHPSPFLINCCSLPISVKLNAWLIFRSGMVLKLVFKAVYYSSRNILFQLLRDSLRQFNFVSETVQSLEERMILFSEYFYDSYM